MESNNVEYTPFNICSICFIPYHNGGNGFSCPKMDKICTKEVNETIDD